MAKFADVFAQMGVPYPFKVAAVNRDVQSQYGVQHVVKVLYAGVELDWWLKTDRFAEQFPNGVAAGDDIAVTKESSPNDPSRSYYTVEIISGMRTSGEQPEQQTAPVMGTPPAADTPPPSFEQKVEDEKTMWERKDNRIMLQAYVKSLIESGTQDVDSIKKIARDLAEWTNKTADELTAVNLADEVAEVFS
jgi:hypothetical protein|tara:strand:+ start:1633 stop:2205 length:573 start_codon:yes stop_codon:yes gene_type:complete